MAQKCNHTVTCKNGTICADMTKFPMHIMHFVSQFAYGTGCLPLCILVNNAEGAHSMTQKELCN